MSVKPKQELDAILDPPLVSDDAEWLETNSPKYYTAVQAAVRAGKTPQAIYTHYMQKSPNRQALWLRCKHTAEWLASGEGG